MRVPGGVPALLKAAGLAETLPRTRALREVIHVAYETRTGIDERQDARLRQLLTYIESISAAEAAAASVSHAPPSLRRADDRTVRQRIEAVAEAIGCTLERESRIYRLEPGRGEHHARRRADLAQAGLDIDGLIKTANAGQPVSFSLRGDDVPQPLSPETWTSILRVPERLSGSLLTAILGDRQAAFVYYGLLGADAATREFLDRHPAVVKEILESDRAAVLAGHDSVIRVAGGRFVVPGGPAAEPFWQALADESVARPDRFILKLLDRDGGRLASLLDTVNGLDPPRQAFVLGSWITNADAREDRFRRLYEAYSRLLTSWSPVERPFVRTLYDGAHVLALTSADATGQATGPTWVRLWRKGFESDEIPANPAGELGDPESDGHVDAAWLLQSLVETESSFTARRLRAESWFFGQRVFNGVPRSALPDVLVTIRAFPRFRILLCTLERTGVRDPALLADAARQADRLSRIGDRDRAAIALALYQASLAIIDRARASRTLDAGAAEALVRSLVSVPISQDGEYLGGVGAWMAGTLLPAFDDRLPPRDQPGALPSEEIVLRAMAGRPLSMADSPNLGLWLEGLPYTVDLAAAELSRMRAIRARQNGVPIEAALALGRAATGLGAPGVTLAQLPALAAELDRAARAVLTINGPGMAWLDPKSFRKLADSAGNDIRKIKKPGDLKKLGRIAVPFLRAADRMQAQAALSLVYASVLRDPQSTVLLDGDPAPRHHWGLGEPEGTARQAPPWRDPEPDRAGGWHLKGSILGADLALALESLRRVSLDRFPSPPTLSDLDRQTMAEAVALTAAHDQTDADREDLTGALRRGRRRLEDAIATPSRWPTAADAMQIHDVRRELVAWAIAHEPEAVPALVSLGEIAQMGRLPGTDAPIPDAWGTSGRSYDGRWSLRYPDRLSLDVLSGRKGGTLAVGLVPDLVLSVAEAMHERQVPAALTKAVLECAAQDVIDETQMHYFDDWITLISQARLVPNRLDEYLASLTAGGPLVPAAR